MLFLGVDGGGTKTAALLVDGDGRVLGSATADGSNYHSVGMDVAFPNVRLAVEAALQGRAPDAACFAMAGADQPHDFRALNAQLETLNLGTHHLLKNDVIAALRAGSRFPYGVAVVCGTGFNAGGIGRDGREFRLPAMGPLTGDQPGARRLATRAIGAAFRSWDGRGEPTLLADIVLKHLGAPNFETLAEQLGDGTLNDAHIKSVAPLVFEAAEAGDILAHQFIYEQGYELGLAATAILRKLDLTEQDVDVVLGGSVFYGKGDVLMQTVYSVIFKTAPHVTIKRLESPPVIGAVRLAADSVGVQLPDDLVLGLPPTMQLPSMF
jgi:N-acetylglucosamine kinase-like BadF-type ATPase